MGVSILLRLSPYAVRHVRGPIEGSPFKDRPPSAGRGADRGAMGGWEGVGCVVFPAPEGGGPLGKSNWKRSVRWRESCAAIDRVGLRPHDCGTRRRRTGWQPVLTRRWYSGVGTCLNGDDDGPVRAPGRSELGRTLRSRSGHAPPCRPTCSTLTGEKDASDLRGDPEPPKGIEPLTYSLRVNRSGRLS